MAKHLYIVHLYCYILTCTVTLLILYPLKVFDKVFSIVWCHLKYLLAFTY